MSSMTLLSNRALLPQMCPELHLSPQTAADRESTAGEQRHDGQEKRQTGRAQGKGCSFMQGTGGQGPPLRSAHPPSWRLDREGPPAELQPLRAQRCLLPLQVAEDGTPTPRSTPGRKITSLTL